MYAAKIISILSLALTASAGVMAPREVDRSGDGIWTKAGRVSGLVQKRSVEADGIYNMTNVELADRSAGTGNETMHALQARKEHLECHGKGSHKFALKVEYEEQARDSLIAYCNKPQNAGNCDQSIWARAADVAVYFCLYHSPGKFEENQARYSLSKIASKCREGFAGNIGDDGFAYGVTRFDLDSVCYFEVGYEG
ncbi:uncharacterized protein PG986_013760 [Apiospora aurea]|uniref:Uncharacterized protein n=1 Tax=Apiospora aurea TaxID=335848 RepID=A0ABR1PWF9_9PEZI